MRYCQTLGELIKNLKNKTKIKKLNKTKKNFIIFVLLLFKCSKMAEAITKTCEQKHKTIYYLKKNEVNSTQQQRCCEETGLGSSSQAVIQNLIIHKKILNGILPSQSQFVNLTDSMMQVITQATNTNKGKLRIS